MAGRLKGRKPRLMLTVPQDLHDLIKEIADARGVPMSSVAVELLSEMQPALEAALPIFKKQKQISDELLKTMEETEKEADKLLEGLFKRLENDYVSFRGHFDKRL